MKRMHVHVAVENLDASIRFYSGMFGTAPTRVESDYAKWQLDDPRVNFAISARGAPIGLNHLGIQVESPEELTQMHGRLAALETAVDTQTGTACCYAKSDKYWVNDPSGIAWETFHTLDSIPVFGESKQATNSACCAPIEKPPVKSTAAGGCCGPKHAEKRNCC